MRASPDAAKPAPDQAVVLLVVSLGVELAGGECFDSTVWVVHENLGHSDRDVENHQKTVWGQEHGSVKKSHHRYHHPGPGENIDQVACLRGLGLDAACAQGT